MNQNKLTTDQLLDRYFAGETSLSEENRLREYYRSGKVDSAHERFAPLFAYWSAAAEIEAPASLTATGSPQTTGVTRPVARIRSLRWLVSAAAAVLLLLIANAWCNRQPEYQAGPIAGTAFPIPTPAPATTVDWSKYEVSADEEGYRALRGALKTASTAMNAPAKKAVRELDKLSSRLR